MPNILETPVSSLKGVGPARESLLVNLGVSAVEDLIWFFPRRYEDRRNLAKIKDLVPGRPTVVIAEVREIERKRLRNGLDIVTAVMEDETGAVSVLWFNRKGLEYILKPETKAALFGVPSIRLNALEISNPEFEVVKDCGSPEKFAGIIPVYPSTAGLSQRWLRTLIDNTLAEYLPLIPETLPEWVRMKRDLPPLRQALLEMHSPRDTGEWKKARRRLAYEELFLLQVGLAYKRATFKANRSNLQINDNGRIYRGFIGGLPFALTEAQSGAIGDIFTDLRSMRPLSRLLQGDVGSGKTVVALALAAAVADSGAQTAIMAPTEVLADQLFAQSIKYFTPLGVETVLLKGGQTVTERRAALELIEGGASVVIGTQALLEGKIPWKNLGAVIIDEQHRFGVLQRAAILAYDPVPNLLMMSATPIPRTLTLCLFGDLDVSLLREKPQGRRKVETRIIDGAKMKVLLQFLADEAGNGARAYWICPRVEESGPEAASAEKRFAFVAKHLGRLGVGLLHGRMTSAEKEEILSGFRSGGIKILISTTVVEVGIDVPEASVIVIESPERFGLSQLHQLRGRVGRGSRRGVCVLLVSNSAGEVPARLRALLDTDDGFEIAEADLALRGAGELSGTSQHGVTEFKVADPAKDAELLAEAREDAAEWMENDPGFTQCPEFREKLFSRLSVALGIA